MLFCYSISFIREARKPHAPSHHDVSIAAALPCPPSTCSGRLPLPFTPDSRRHHSCHRPYSSGWPVTTAGPTSHPKLLSRPQTPERPHSLKHEPRPPRRQFCRSGVRDS
ncbi:hypothetical protein PVAP13_8KG138101 [Panicum virgatum]|uniref:Uncharacterized protein n=1 Tax=Panicum virgatum TaxID=38727 RepID=A0A8T0PKD4_PANVG|nr:hypothetical protein PVAP13_8KG138101 [Panicum virgatum]